VEHRFHLSNQSAGAWLWDELKGFLLSLLLGGLLAEIVYGAIRAWPLHGGWWRGGIHRAQRLFCAIAPRRALSYLLQIQAAAG